MATETNDLSDVRTYTYNDDLELASITDRNGRVREFEYDDLYRLTEERWLDDQQQTIRTLSFTYDILNRLTVAEDLDDQSNTLSKLTYTYDNLGRVDTVSNADTLDVPEVVLDSDYDLRGSRTQLSSTVDASADFSNTYQYDARGFLEWVKQTGTGVADKRVDFTYNDAGQFETITRYSDLSGTTVVATSDYLYDGIGRLTDLTHKDGSATPVTLAGYDWVYDAASRITSFTSSVDGTVTYSYDAAGQLVDADFSYQTDEDYTYDLNGNRTNTGYSTGDNNQLLDDGTYTYEYDDEGNRTKRTETATGDYVEYEWDHRNRLVKVSFYDDQDTLQKEIEYRYDAFDRRIAKLLDADGNSTFESEEHYVYDGIDVVLQYDESSDLTHRYLHGPAVDQILADEDALGDVLWPLADNQGTVRDLVDSDGDVQNHLAYDAFGQITSETNSAVDHLFAYTGREWDEDVDLYYYRARWYDPAVGRFLSEDPIISDLNLTRYVGNSPANDIDPSGMAPPIPPFPFLPDARTTGGRRGFIIMPDGSRIAIRPQACSTGPFLLPEQGFLLPGGGKVSPDPFFLPPGTIALPPVNVGPGMPGWKYNLLSQLGTACGTHKLGQCPSANELADATEQAWLIYEPSWHGWSPWRCEEVATQCFFPGLDVNAYKGGQAGNPCFRLEYATHERTGPDHCFILIIPTAGDHPPMALDTGLPYTGQYFLCKPRRNRSRLGVRMC